MGRSERDVPRVTSSSATLGTPEEREGLPRGWYAHAGGARAGYSILWLTRLRCCAGDGGEHFVGLWDV